MTKIDIECVRDIDATFAFVCNNLSKQKSLKSIVRPNNNWTT